MTNQERAAEVILKAEYEHRGHTCDLYTDTHVYAKALADAGLLMPDLPAPDEDEWEVFGNVISLDGMHILPMIENDALTPDEAREIAYMLLAAAKLAEEQG